MDSSLNHYYASYNFPPVMSKDEEAEVGKKLSSENKKEQQENASYYDRPRYYSIEIAIRRIISLLHLKRLGTP